MTVAELCKVLENAPDDAPVYLESSHDDIQDIDIVSIEYIVIDNIYVVTLKS